MFSIILLKTQARLWHLCPGLLTHHSLWLEGVGVDFDYVPEGRGDLKNFKKGWMYGAATGLLKRGLVGGGG